jgi:hypothetical protein
MPCLDSASERQNRREKIIQDEQYAAKDKHEESGYQDEHEKGAIKDKPNRTADIFPRVIVQRMMKSGCLHALR